MAVNLLVDFAEGRFGDDAVARAGDAAHARGYRLIEAESADDRLAAWIDLHFAPSWWSSEARAARVWYAFAPGGELAGFAAYDARELRFPWLRAYAARRDVGIFGPFGVAPEHRKTGAGEALLAAALGSLRRRGYARALIPAVAGERLIASYTSRAGARVADEFTYDAPRRYRATIMASGGGTNAQNVIDRAADGTLPLEIGAVIANRADAFALERARRAGVEAHSVVWDRAAEPRARFDARVIDAVARTAPDLVLLLGWMHLLPAAFIDRFDQILNLHPAFLPFDPRADSVVMPDGSSIPAFRGAHALRDALAAGVAWSGASMHHITAEADRGPIVVRTPFPLDAAGGADAVARTLNATEHGVVRAAIRRWTFER